jgi:hypothetical protein
VKNKAKGLNILDIHFFECSRKKMLHSSSCFHFVDVNIAPPLVTNPLQNNILWKVMYDIIHIKDQHFIGGGRT